MFNVPPSGRRVTSRRWLNSFHTRRRMSCVTEFTAVVIRVFRSFKVVGRYGKYVKLLLLRTPTRKSRRVWDQEISGARTEAPGLLCRRDLSIVEVEIHSENVEYPGANGVELRSVGKWSLLNFHSFEEEASFAASRDTSPQNRVFSKKERSIDLCLR